jgi:glutamate-1-semialdehyde aminotransferase
MSEGTSTGRVAKGDRLYEHAVGIIPGGSQTGSKMPPAGLRGVYPPFIQRGLGPYVWDLDGNRYIDHKLGCGPIILGHAYPVVTEAAIRQLRDGSCYPSAHPSEVELAELLIELIPCAQMVRFLKTGAEGTSAAVRLARTHTGRDLVISSGYHGWHDWSMARNSNVLGVPKCLHGLTLDLGFGDYDKLERLLRDKGSKVAALIIAGPYDQTLESIASFLKRARELTYQHGALLVYDEIVTGFRVALGGLQELVGVVPDLAVFSKGMANGFPICAVVGSKAVMQAWERTTISSTFGGEAVSIAASIACIRELRDKGALGEISKRGAWLKAQAESLGRDQGVRLSGRGYDALPSIVLEGEDARLYEPLQRALLNGGIFPYYPLWYISYSHDMSVMVETMAGFRQALTQAKSGEVA